jgi:hypothetical protein
VTPGTAPHVSPLVASATVLVALPVVTWRSSSDPVAPSLAATLVAFLVWTAGYVLRRLRRPRVESRRVAAGRSLMPGGEQGP